MVSPVRLYPISFLVNTSFKERKKNAKQVGEEYVEMDGIKVKRRN